jgi:DNA end-binding protein Ku
MAQSLIESMSVAWEPDKYRDEYRNAVMEMIEQKAQHKEIAKKPAPAMRATNVVDLVKVLQESLNRNQSIKPKRNGARSASNRSTTTLVKQKRRVAA